MKESMKQTAIVSFGDTPGSGGSVSVEIDPRHKESDGNLPSRFLPDEEVFFLIYSGPEIEIVSVRATDGGSVLLHGPVRITHHERLTIPDSDAVSLAHQPIGPVHPVRWYGRRSHLVTEGAAVRSAAWPVLVDVACRVQAFSCSHRLAGGITVAPGQEFPVVFVVEYREAQ